MLRALRLLLLMLLLRCLLLWRRRRQLSCGGRVRKRNARARYGHERCNPRTVFDAAGAVAGHKCRLMPGVSARMLAAQPWNCCVYV